MSRTSDKKPTKTTPKKTKSRPKKVPKTPKVVDLDEEIPESSTPIEPSEPEKPTLGMRLHFLNVRFPWFKVVLLLLLAGGVAFSVEELLRHNVSQPVNIPAETVITEVPEGQVIDETQSTVEKTPEAPTEAENPAVETPQAVQPSQTAAAQPSTPATVPTQSTGRKLVALTFDDGPSATQTPRLLQILREKNVKATFFVLGNMAQKSPNILRQEESDGHEVGSHTMTHANLKRSTVEGIKWEVAAINGVFVEILGHSPSLMRPPYGNINESVRTYANLPLILWAVDPEDWKYRDATTVRRNVVGATFDGAIVLMHDIHATTVDAVAGIIDDLRAQGYEFMTVSELAKARGVVLKNGVSYGSFRP